MQRSGASNGCVPLESSEPLLAYLPRQVSPYPSPLSRDLLLTASHPRACLVLLTDKHTHQRQAWARLTSKPAQTGDNQPQTTPIHTWSWWGNMSDVSTQFLAPYHFFLSSSFAFFFHSLSCSSFSAAQEASISYNVVQRRVWWYHQVPHLTSPHLTCTHLFLHRFMRNLQDSHTNRGGEQDHRPLRLPSQVSVLS